MFKAPYHPLSSTEVNHLNNIDIWPYICQKSRCKAETHGYAHRIIETLAVRHLWKPCRTAA